MSRLPPSKLVINFGIIVGIVYWASFIFLAWVLSFYDKHKLKGNVTPTLRARLSLAAPPKTANANDSLSHFWEVNLSKSVDAKLPSSTFAVSKGGNIRKRSMVERVTPYA